MNDMDTRARGQQWESEAWASMLDGTALTDELEGHTDDDRDSWSGWTELSETSYGRGSSSSRNRSNYVTHSQLQNAIMKVVDLEEELETCTRHIQRAFQQLDNPDFTPGEEELELYQAWRDSQQWIEKQDELNKSLAKAQRKLSKMEKCVARQDRFTREISAIVPEAGSSNESPSSHDIQPVNNEQQLEQQHSLENPARANEVIEILDSNDELSEASPVQQHRSCPVVDAQQDDHPSCVICRDDMQAGSTLALECAHVFHTECIETWLKRKKNCPICMREVSNYGESNIFVGF